MVRPAISHGLLREGDGDGTEARAQGKGPQGTGKSGCTGPKAGVSLECPENSQEASYLTLTTALRMRYNYYPHCPDVAQEAQRGLPKVTEKVTGPGFQPAFSQAIQGLLSPELPQGGAGWGKAPKLSESEFRLLQTGCVMAGVMPPCWASVASALVDLRGLFVHLPADEGGGRRDREDRILCSEVILSFSGMSDLMLLPRRV